MNTSTPLFFRPKNPTSPLHIERSEGEYTESLHVVSHREYTDRGCRISCATLSDNTSYHTMITDDIRFCPKSDLHRYSAVLTSLLLSYLKKNKEDDKNGNVLFCGLGNGRLTADALGPMICHRLSASGEDPLLGSDAGSLYVLKPGVPSQTGMKTGDHIRAVAEKIRPQVIITADAAAAKTAQRLASVVQITDIGVRAGAGVGKDADEISRRTMPCPVISISVPTVIRADLSSGEGEDFLVSPCDIDHISERYANMIALSLNRIFAPLLCEEIFPI